MVDTLNHSKVGTTEFIVTSFNTDVDDWTPDDLRWQCTYPTEAEAGAAVTPSDTVCKMERFTWVEDIFEDGGYGTVRDAEIVFDDDFYREWSKADGWSAA